MNRGGPGGQRLLSGALYGLMLWRQAQQAGLFERGRKLPAATLTIAGAAFALYYARPELQRFLPFSLHTADAAIRPDLVIHDPLRQWTRLFTGAILHGSDLHLYYNLGSLLWKGSQLEDRLGTPRFTALALILTGMAGAFFVLLSELCVQSGIPALMYGLSDYRSYTVGLSGLLFAMKVLLLHDPHLAAQSSTIMGFSVPNRYAAWAELALNQVLVPSSSFLGHVGGILAGMVYLAARSTTLGRTLGLTVIFAPLLWLWRVLGGSGGHGGAAARNRFTHDPNGHVLGRAGQAPQPRHGTQAQAQDFHPHQQFTGHAQRFPAPSAPSLSPAPPGGASSEAAAAHAFARNHQDDDDVSIVAPRASAPPMPSGDSPPAPASAASASGLQYRSNAATGANGNAKSAAARPIPASATATPEAAGLYRSEMEQLLSMGLRDRRANFAALKACNGDVQAAVARLI